MRSFLFATAALLLVACSANTAPEASSQDNVTAAHANQIVVGESDANKTIQIQEGKKLVISLPSNASTGFRWNLVEDGGLGDAVGGMILPQDAPPGQGGYQTFTWSDTTGKAGAHALKLTYERPWAETVPPAKTFAVTIDVTAAERHCGGFAGLTCAEHEFCDMTREDICGMADAMGTCREKPQFCPMNVQPVCGCDGQTYSNSCVAASHGAAIRADGPCATH